MAKIGQKIFPLTKTTVVDGEEVVIPDSSSFIEKTIDIKLDTEVVPDTATEVTFIDSVMKINEPLVADAVYHLKFNTIYDVESSYQFDVVLENEDSSKQQIVKRIKILQNTDENTEAPISLIFMPNSEYTKILLKIVRERKDYSSSIDRRVAVSNFTLERMKNVLGGEVLQKVGIQAPSGQMFTINGEEMRVGRSGIYELYHNGIDITFLGFATNNNVVNDNADNFIIVDYKTKEVNK